MGRLRLFGTSGIRGIANLEITVQMAAKLGLAFASFLGNEGTVVVGRDVRLSAKAFSFALISGLLSGGVNVADCGVAPTPAVLWALKKRGFIGAAIVTGSHTPKERSGFLFFRKDTAELSKEESEHFENTYFSEIKPLPWNKTGKLFEVEVADLYLKCVLEQVNLKKLQSANFRVVLDPGNGASAPFCTPIFQAADLETVVINKNPDGAFPGRDPYPKSEVLSDLASKVQDCKADIGSATDADGDRAIFADHTGTILWGDVTGSVFMKDALIGQGGGVVVAPINSSQLVGWVCDRHNGRLVYSEVGSPAIVNTVKRENALMGMEETGKNIWVEAILYGDWILSTLKMLEIMANEQKSLSEIVHEFPQFYMRKEGFHCSEKIKNVVFDHAVKEWKKRGEDAEIITIDGARINYSDGSWILFRPSGTEPVFRVYSESKIFSRMEELAMLGADIVNKSVHYANKKRLS